MYHYQTAYRPHSNPYFAASIKPAEALESSSLSENPTVKSNSAARTDLQIEQDLRDELEMEPSVRAAAIGVQVRDGVATLTGVVDDDGERWLIESAARRIAGVNSLLVQLKVFTPDIVLSDDEIEKDCERVLGGLRPKSDYAIRVTVSHGWVRLLGDVAEGYERRIAETEVGSLLSVHGVNSQVKVRPSLARPNGSANVAYRYIHI